MEGKINYDFLSLEGIFQRPETLNALPGKNGTCQANLRDYEVYNCPSCCKQCCYSSILMSYTEFTYIMLISRKTGTERIEKLFRDKVGIYKTPMLCSALSCRKKPARNTAASTWLAPDLPGFRDRGSTLPGTYRTQEAPESLFTMLTTSFITAMIIL